MRTFSRFPRGSRAPPLPPGSRRFQVAGRLVDHQPPVGASSTHSRRPRAPPATVTSGCQQRTATDSSEEAWAWQTRAGNGLHCPGRGCHRRPSTHAAFITAHAAEARTTTHHEHGVVVAPAVRRPRAADVFGVAAERRLHAGMDFVVVVLMRFFPMTEKCATQMMLHVHTRGRRVRVFTRRGSPDPRSRR